MKTNIHSWIFKFSLLSISLLLMSAPVISPAIPLLIANFPNESQSNIELLLTIPNFGIIFSLFISPFIIRLAGKKKTIIVGLILALLSGILPYFIDVFPAILVSRFLYGAGIGLFNSMAVSLLAEFYGGEELSTMMGFQSMGGSLGSAILSFVISYLVTFGWQQIFLVYLTVLPILFLFAFFVKIDDKEQKDEVQNIHEEKNRVNSSVIGLSVLMFFLFIFFMTSVIKLPELIMSSGMGTASNVSVIAGISTLVGIPVGIFYGKIHTRLDNSVLPIGLLLCALGFLIIAIAQVLPILIVGVILIGVGFGFSVPYIYT